MPRKLLSGIFCLMVVAFMAAGCASSKAAKATTGGKVTISSYIEDRQRVDQKMEGNFGYLSGTPVAPDRSNVRPTKKIYVLEISKEAAVPADLMEGASSHSVSVSDESQRQKVESGPNPIFLPSFEDTQAQRDEAPADGSSVEYVVEKDDTLQKIAKKFYGGYSKWPRIYEANKEAIKDPNRIKQGIVLRIPMD